MIVNPFAQVDISTVFRQHKLEREMPVSKDKIIIVLLFKYRTGVNDQPFFVFTTKILQSAGGNAAAGRPSLRNTYAQVRMQPRKQPLAEPATKNLFQKFVGAVAGPQSIAMMQIKCFSAALYNQVVVHN